MPSASELARQADERQGAEIDRDETLGSRIDLNKPVIINVRRGRLSMDLRLDPLMVNLMRPEILTEQIAQSVKPWAEVMAKELNNGR